MIGMMRLTYYTDNQTVLYIVRGWGIVTIFLEEERKETSKVLETLEV